MRVSLLFRDGPAARFVAGRIAEKIRPDAIVLESGRTARRKKLRRELGRGFPLRLPLALLDVAANAVYQGAWSRYLNRRLAELPPHSSRLDDVNVTRVDDANSDQARAALRAAHADVIVVFGTSILRGATLHLAHRHMLNVHGGIVPEYRNVHSELWAMLRGDRERIGVSILHLDAGIDSGGIAVRRFLPVRPGETFFDLRFRNICLAADAIVEALERAKAGSLPSEPQDAGSAGFYRTPGFRELMRLWWRMRGGMRDSDS